MGLAVVGMHRSGTSAVARVLDGLGLAVGGPEMVAAPDNPRGFFERRDVMELNDRWLAGLGGTWWAPPRTTQATWSSLDRQAIQAERASLDFLGPDAKPWFVKDPRISLLLPLWDRLALQNLPTVLCIRDPRDCARSLALRDGISPRRALALWMTYVRQAVVSSQDRDVLVIDYERLLREPLPALGALADFATDATGTTGRFHSLEELQHLVEPGLQRNRRSTLNELSTDEVSAALDVYHSLAERHGTHDASALMMPESPAWVEATLEELRETYALELSSASLSARVSTLEDELQTWNRPDERIADLQEMLVSREAEQMALQARADASSVELESRSAALARQTEVIETLERTLDARVDELNEVRRQRQALEGDVGRIRPLLDEALTERRSSETALSHAQEQLREATLELQRANLSASFDIRERDARVVELAGQVMALGEREAERSLTIDSMSAQLAERAAHIEHLQMRLAELTGSVATADGELSRARQTLDDQMQMHAMLLGERQSQIDVLEARLAESFAAAIEGDEQLVREQMRSSTLQLRIDELERSRADRDLAFDALQRSLADLENRHSELSNLSAVRQELFDQLTSDHSSLAELEESRARELDTTRVRLAERDAEFVELESAWESAHVALEERLADSAAARAALETTLGRSARRVEFLEGRVARDEVTKMEFGRRIGDLRVELAARAAEFSALRVEFDALGVQLAETLLVRRELSAAQATIRLQRESLESLTASMERTRADGWRSRTQAAADAAAAESALRTAEAALTIERVQRERLANALRDAIAQGQNISGELELLRDSRSYRLGRRLTSPGRLFKRDPQLDGPP